MFYRLPVVILSPTRLAICSDTLGSLMTWFMLVCFAPSGSFFVHGKVPVVVLPDCVLEHPITQKRPITKTMPTMFRTKTDIFQKVSTRLCPRDRQNRHKCLGKMQKKSGSKFFLLLPSFLRKFDTPYLVFYRACGNA